MVIEELEVDVVPADEAGWLAADEAVWTAFLRRQPGFVRKEVWRPHDRPGVLVVQIWWESDEQWKVISEAQVAEADLEMGDWFREVRGRQHTVLRSYG